MPSHHLILAYSMQDRMHYGPWRRGLAPAALCLFGRQRYNRAAANVHMKRAPLDKHAAPDNLSRFADALERSAAEGEVHGRLALAARARVTAHKMIGGRGAGDLQDPDKVVHAVALVVLAPAHVVQRGGGIEPQSRP